MYILNIIIRRQDLATLPNLGRLYLKTSTLDDHLQNSNLNGQKSIPNSKKILNTDEEELCIEAKNPYI